MSPQEAVRRLVRYQEERCGSAAVSRDAKTDKQALVDKFYYWNYADGLEAARLETYLSDRMLKTRRPLQEKLVLFWHGHFASGNEKVHDYRKMMGQFAVLREKPTGICGICWWVSEKIRPC